MLNFLRGIYVVSTVSSSSWFLFACLLVFCELKLGEKTKVQKGGGFEGIGGYLQVAFLPYNLF